MMSHSKRNAAAVGGHGGGRHGGRGYGRGCRRGIGAIDSTCTIAQKNLSAANFEGKC